MTYIAPNSTLKLLHNVPLDPRYENTIWFPKTDVGITSQYTYFSDKTKYTFNNQSYQRVGIGKLRIERQCDDLYDCNYLMFQNTNFTGKWFYAFITNVAYINNVVSEVSYVIDVMQTWNKEYTLNHCYVEREHTANDNFFINNQPEPVNIGNTYMIEQRTNRYYSGNYLFACYADANKNGNIVMNTYYTDMQYDYIDEILPSRVQNIHDKLQAYQSSLVSAFVFPKELITLRTEGDIIVGEPSDRYYVINMQPFLSGEYMPNLQGYTIKNRKLMNEPFVSVRVTNNIGEYHNYGLQYFDYNTSLGANATFVETGTLMPEPQIAMYPLNYKGVESNTDEAIYFNNYILVPVALDPYKQWWLENKYQSKMEALVASVGSQWNEYGFSNSNPMGGLINNMASNIPSNVQEGLSNVTQFFGGVLSDTGATLGRIKNVQTIENLKNAPSSSHAGSSNNVLFTNQHKYGFTVDLCCPKLDILKSIDSFFERFGYSTNMTKIPNTNVRPHWTYTKTIGCTINGNIPQSDANEICSIFDKGITFWVHGSEVGNYSLDNSLGIIT